MDLVFGEEQGTLVPSFGWDAWCGGKRKEVADGRL